MIGSVLAIAKGGSGVVCDGEKTVFIPGVIAGESVEFSLAGRRRSAWQGKLLRVLVPSPRRTRPLCPHAGECGGCNLQHMEYGEQLRVKEEILRGNLRKIAGMEAGPPVDIGVLASPPWRYRSKAEFQVRGGASGFFARESRRVVALSGCLLLPEVVERFFLAWRPAATGIGDGQLRVVCNGRDLAARIETASGAETWAGGARDVPFTAGRCAYRFAPENFVQANLFQLQPMLGLLEAVLERERPKTAVDLFCGAGFLTLPLALGCREVLAVENDAANVAGLLANLKLNRAGNVRVVQADALHASIPDAELIVVDPPRGGLSPRLIAALTASSARAVVYYSCDSATFARDLRLFLKQGLALEELKLVDNFPQSDHFEIFSVLKKADS